jgi:hypothetical protein
VPAFQELSKEVLFFENMVSDLDFEAWSSKVAYDLLKEVAGDELDDVFVELEVGVFAVEAHLVLSAAVE